MLSQWQLQTLDPMWPQKQFVGYEAVPSSFQELHELFLASWMLESTSFSWFLRAKGVIRLKTCSSSRKTSACPIFREFSSTFDSVDFLYSEAAWRTVSHNSAGKLKAFSESSRLKTSWMIRTLSYVSGNKQFWCWLSANFMSENPDSVFMLCGQTSNTNSHKDPKDFHCCNSDFSKHSRKDKFPFIHSFAAANSSRTSTFTRPKKLANRAILVGDSISESCMKTIWQFLVRGLTRKG